MTLQTNMHTENKYRNLINDVWTQNWKGLVGLTDEARNTVIADLVFFAFRSLDTSLNQKPTLDSKIVEHKAEIATPQEEAEDSFLDSLPEFFEEIPDHRETPEFKQILELVRIDLPRSHLSPEQEETLKNLYNAHHAAKQTQKELTPRNHLILTKLSCEKLDILLEKLKREEKLSPDEHKMLRRLTSLRKERLKAVNSILHYRPSSSYALKEKNMILQHKEHWRNKLPKNEEGQYQMQSYIVNEGLLKETMPKTVLEQANMSLPKKGILKGMEKNSSKQFEENPLKKLRFADDIMVQNIPKGKSHRYTPHEIKDSWFSSFFK